VNGSSHFQPRSRGLGCLNLDDEVEEGKELDVATKGLEESFRDQSRCTQSFSFPLSRADTDEE